ncbi:hypothetical protein [Methylomonas sp. AM2-LC]|uniref:hypothetical protein n=1 Tax=Methylomonas sp. AM2-LC TaxID=3153301 RepID=UPI0032641F48
MFKIYKKVVVVNASDPNKRLEANAHGITPETGTFSLSNLLTIPAMIIGGLVSIIFFSAFFVLLLIPAGILSYKAWRLFKNAQQTKVADSLEAEYTVIKDETDKY